MATQIVRQRFSFLIFMRMKKISGPDVIRSLTHYLKFDRDSGNFKTHDEENALSPLMLAEAKVIMAATVMTSLLDKIPERSLLTLGIRSWRNGPCRMHQQFLQKGWKKGLRIGGCEALCVSVIEIPSWRQAANRYLKGKRRGVRSILTGRAATWWLRVVERLIPCDTYEASVCQRRPADAR